MSDWQWIAPEQPRPLATNRGWQLGDGFFTTMRCTGSDIELWPYHWQRLQTSCQVLGIEIPDPAILQERIQQVILQKQLPSQALRLSVWREQPSRGYRVSTEASVCFSVQSAALPKVQAPWRVKLSEIILAGSPQLKGIKHSSRITQVLAANHLGDYDECLMGDGQFWYSGHKSNLFFKIDGCWNSPDNSAYGVCGVMQAHIVDCFSQHGLTIQRCPLAAKDLQQVEAMFMTNALVGAVPVAALAEQPLALDDVANLFAKQLKSPHLYALS